MKKFEKIGLLWDDYLSRGGCCEVWYNPRTNRYRVLEEIDYKSPCYTWLVQELYPDDLWDYIRGNIDSLEMYNRTTHVSIYEQCNIFMLYELIKDEEAGVLCTERFSHFEPLPNVRYVEKEEDYSLILQHLFDTIS